MQEKATHPGHRPLVDMRAWALENPVEFEKYVTSVCGHLDKDYAKLCQSA